MSFLDYLMRPMGAGPGNPTADAAAPPVASSFIQETNPLFWAGIGMLSDTGYSPVPGGVGRPIKAAMSGLQMGNAMAQQEQAQKLEWAKLQGTLAKTSLESEKLRMDIDEARRKRQREGLAARILGAPGAPREIAGPVAPGQAPLGAAMEGGTGYLGGQFSAPEAGALLASLGRDYMPVAQDLLKRGEPPEPLKPKDRFVKGADGALWDVSDPTNPRHIAAPGGTGGNGFKWSDMRPLLNDYTAESVRAAAAAGDPTVLQPRGVYDPSKMTATDIRSFKNDFQENTATAREGASSVKKMMMALNEPGAITDVASLYGFIKAIDPGSVVREGEVHIVQSARGLVENLKSLLQKAQGRGFLTDADRRQLASIGTNLMQHYQESYTSWRDHYEKVVNPVLQRSQVDPAIVYGPRPRFNAPALDPRFQAPAPGVPPVSAGNQPAAAAAPLTPQEQTRMQELEAKARGLFTDTGVAP